MFKKIGSFWILVCLPACLLADFSYDQSSKMTGGYEAKEMLMTMQMDATDEKTGNKGGMQVSSSMWLAPKVAGYDEIREFHKKMAMKLAWAPGASSMMAGRQDIARGMAGVYKEAAKLDGIPVLQVMKMIPTSDGQPVSAQSGSDGQAASQETKPKAETPSLSGALAGKLGGFGGFGRKKKPEQPKEEAKADPAPSSAAPAGDSSARSEEHTSELQSLT